MTKTDQRQGRWPVATGAWILAGSITVPIGGVRQGFIDAADAAAVLVETLLDERHTGQTYVVTGPTALSFAEAVSIISDASGHRVRFAGDVDSYREGQEALGADPDQTQREVDNFARVQADRQPHLKGQRCGPVAH